MDVRYGGNIFSAAIEQDVAWQGVLDLSASINPLGPPAGVREAILAGLDRIGHYPDRSGGQLRQHLAEAWGMKPETIAVGNGATDLLFDWCLWQKNGSLAAPAFGEFHRAWPQVCSFPLAERTKWPKDGPVVLTRPANPTGTLIDSDFVQQYAAGWEDAVLVDESFIDFCVQAKSLVSEARGNLFVLRSLTKFWALPGLRVGALVGDVETLASSRPPWGLTVLAEAAALAALRDAYHAARSREYVHTEGAWLVQKLSALPGFRVWPCIANYLYIETECAAELTAYAPANQILIRDCSSWTGLDASPIRVAVRRRWENEILLRTCEDFVCG